MMFDSDKVIYYYDTDDSQLKISITSLDADGFTVNVETNTGMTAIENIMFKAMTG